MIPAVNNHKILVIDDDEDILIAASLMLKRKYPVVRTVKDPIKSYNMLRAEHFDAVLLDMNFSSDTTSGREGFLYLKNILSIVPHVPVIIITAYGDIDMAVRGIKEGAYDFILKPWKNERLMQAVESAIQLAENKKLNSRRSNTTGSAAQNDFIGQSQSMQEVYSIIKKVAATDANVLITGENGTGKELVAKSLHKQSKRAANAFVSVDIGSISESLFESELFGHVKGAFTDAREDRKGRFETAAGGTLFLDEIGNLSLPMQAKLLNAIQERRISRVGSSQAIETDIRLICATNVNLQQMVKEGRFRQDLLFRINTVEIHLPALRNRDGDINLITDHFIRFYAAKYERNFLPLSQEVKKALNAYHWPGNVRELQHRMERAVILCEGNELKIDDFHLPELDEIMEGDLPNYKIKELERSAIMKMLKKHGGNITHAAKELGLSRAALYRRIEKYDL